jgi:hypothetical protein
MAEMFAHDEGAKSNVWTLQPPTIMKAVGYPYICDLEEKAQSKISDM